ncbi:hypothetical protein M0R45_035808 [Rubus argutus]|uniref:Zinc knuckle CX2CX4HX4C domain-containing protein n=1 Tax=Rubus argutus TaxID=59490 RepID=A0AAW1VX33_RUBAR
MFGSGGGATHSQHFYALDCLLTPWKSVDPKAFFGFASYFVDPCSCCAHGLKDLVKQAFPPMEFEFSLGVSALLHFKYDGFVGFCKLCGLLEHASRVCLRAPFEAAIVEAPVKNPIPSPKPNSLSRVKSAFLQLGSRSNAYVSSSDAHYGCSALSCAPLGLSGVKRQARLVLVTVGKRPRVLDAASKPPLMDIELDLAFSSKEGALIISPGSASIDVLWVA